MNRPRGHKVLADLWGNRVRSLLVIASITVGLFSVGVINTRKQILAEDLRTGYAAVNPANIQISASLFVDDIIDHI